jgi:hypothetical protein
LLGNNNHGAYPEKDGASLDYYLPQWDLVGLAMTSFLLAAEGWDCIRMEGNFNLGLCAFVAGCVF